MSTLTICATPPLPTFNSLYTSFKPLLTGSFAFPNFPPLPTLPSPIFVGFHAPSIEAVQLAAELQCTQVLNVILAMFKPIVEFLGIGLNDVLPIIPYLNINLIGLLQGNVSDFIAQLAGIAIGDIIEIISIPGQLYNNYVIPSLSTLQTFQLLIRNYISQLTNTLSGLVMQVAQLIGVPVLVIPYMPGFGGFYTSFVAPILNKLSINVNGILVLPISIAELLGLINLALASFGFVFEFDFPDPLLLTLNIPNFELLEQLKNFFTNFSIAPLQLLLNFIVNDLHLSITIPQICIPITIPNISVPILILPKFSLPKLAFNIPKVPIPKLDLTVKLPNISLPNISIPSVTSSIGNISGVSVSLPSIPSVSVNLPSISIPSIPKLNFNIPKISIPKFTFPNLPFPTFIPSISLPKISLPKLPSIPVIPVPNLNLYLNVQANINIKV